MDQIAIDQAQRSIGDDQIKLHPVQLGNLVLRTFRTFDRVFLSYKLINDFIRGKRKMPVLKGTIPGPQPPPGEESELITLEFDVNEFFRHIPDEGKRNEAVTASFYAWNNHYGQQIGGTLQALAEASRNAFAAFFQQEPRQMPPGDREFEELVGKIVAAHSLFADAWKLYTTAEAAVASDTGVGTVMPTLQLGGANVSLEEILSTAGVTEPEKRNAVAKELVTRQLSELTKEFQPLLEQLAATTTAALATFNQKSSQT